MLIFPLSYKPRLWSTLNDSSGILTENGPKRERAIQPGGLIPEFIYNLEFGYLIISCEA